MLLLLLLLLVDSDSLLRPHDGDKSTDVVQLWNDAVAVAVAAAAAAAAAAEHKDHQPG
jgi:hypothetical protein